VAYLLLNAASYDGEIWHADAYRPCAEHVLGFMSIGVVVTKIMTFFPKCVQIGLDFCCGDLRSVGATAGSRPIPAGRLAGCSSALGSYCIGLMGRNSL